MCGRFGCSAIACCRLLPRITDGLIEAKREKPPACTMVLQLLRKHTSTIHEACSKLSNTKHSMHWSLLDAGMHHT